VVGESTAHTVTIKSIGFIPEILKKARLVEKANTNPYAAGNEKFRTNVRTESPGPGS
jgi:hypothetical protein